MNEVVKCANFGVRQHGIRACVVGRLADLRGRTGEAAFARQKAIPNWKAVRKALQQEGVSRVQLYKEVQELASGWQGDMRREAGGVTDAHRAATLARKEMWPAN